MEKKTVYIKFYTGVNENSVKKLMHDIEQKLKEGIERFVIVISSPGGSVLHGLSAYNFLKGIPAEVITHNFGSVDSMGAVIYCAGHKRLCVPHARFLLHPPRWGSSGAINLDEKGLEENLKGLRIDIDNIAGVIAATVGKSESEVHRDMTDRTTLSPEQAVEYGLVHEISPALFQVGAEIIDVE